jgi:uncharacterized protein YecA (UPF0149 family)
VAEPTTSISIWDPGAPGGDAGAIRVEVAPDVVHVLQYTADTSSYHEALAKAEQLRQKHASAAAVASAKLQGDKPTKLLPFEYVGDRVGRNDPCPCGCGRKRKHHRRG